MTELPSTETVSLQPEPSLPPPLAAGTLLAGRYRLGAVLGSGGYGVVYCAVDETTGASLAVKALRAERLSAAGRQRLVREASLLAGLDHPHLVRVFEAGESEGVAYLTMELVDGEPLRERLLREVPPVAEAVRIAREVLAGLAALHGRGIVHRDVKPGNVLLDGKGRAKLADFGLVRRFDADATRATSSLAVVGTAEYLSPEQALGEELDGRSDLYSLGVVLYEMLAGRPVHERRSTFATVLARLHEPVPEVRELRPEVPGWLSSVVGRLLEKEAGQRYASAEEALADLEGERVPKAVLRRKLLRRGALVTMASLFVAAAIVGWAWTRWRGGFDRLAIDGPDHVTALDRAGRPLWSRSGHNSPMNFVPLRVDDSGEIRIAALLATGAEAVGPSGRHHISLLDPQSGEVADELDLPSSAAQFAAFEDRYGPKLHALDIDGDGIDELLVSYTHETSWPSYTVLFEPRQRRAHAIFVGGGHHVPVSVADVDGDGRNEVIFVGTANRLGWYLGLAAVAVRPWMDEASSPGLGGMQAASPDQSNLPESSLCWYALLPRGGASGSRQPVMVDRAARRFEVHYFDGRRFEVSFDGFVLGEPGGGALAKNRIASRDLAYQNLRGASAMIGGGFPQEAVSRAEAAIAASRQAADPRLLEWSERVRITALVAAGRRAEAEQRARELAAKSDAAPEIAYDLARALHRYGEPLAAVEWYRRGLGPGSEEKLGRRYWEFLEGATIALAGLGRWEEVGKVARLQIEAFPASMPLAELYLEWSRLRRGLPIQRGPLRVTERHLASDFAHMVLTEVELAGGTDPRSLLATAESYAPKAVATAYCRDWALALVLARLDRRDDALAAARRALALARREADGEPEARSLEPRIADLVAALERR